MLKNVPFLSYWITNKLHFLSSVLRIAAECLFSLHEKTLYKPVLITVVFLSNSAKSAINTHVMSHKFLLTSNRQNLQCPKCEENDLSFCKYTSIFGVHIL